MKKLFAVLMVIVLPVIGIAQRSVSPENVPAEVSKAFTTKYPGQRVEKWKQEDFIPYLDMVTESFGPGRIMYGSDWPVCLVAASYKEVIGIAEKYFSSFSENEQQAIFGENAKKFYHLS